LISIARGALLTNNSGDSAASAQGEAMTKRNWQLISAAVALAACLPLPAAAEVHGAAKCVNASWSALAAGECGVGDLHILRVATDGKEEQSTELLVGTGGNVDIIPEPETYALMLLGLIAVAVAARKKLGR
jgi:PEP-CTERM motif